MVRFFALLAFAAALGAAPTLATAAEPRFALVIGTASGGAPETRVHESASVIGNALRGAGFDVEARTDLDAAATRRAMREFAARVEAARGEAYAVLYVGGRILQVEGRNFLLPQGTDVRRASDVPIEGVAVGDLMAALAAAPAKGRLLMVDPAPGRPVEGAEAGLAAIEPARGSFVVVSTAPGEAPVEGQGRGAFAEAFLRAANSGNSEVEALFERVKAEVASSTGGEQKPVATGALAGPFVLVQGGAERAQRDPAKTTAATPEPQRTVRNVTPERPAATPAPQAEAAAEPAPPAEPKPDRVVRDVTPGAKPREQVTAERAAEPAPAPQPPVRPAEAAEAAPAEPEERVAAAVEPDRTEPAPAEVAAESPAEPVPLPRVKPPAPPPRVAAVRPIPAPGAEEPPAGFGAPRGLPPGRNATPGFGEPPPFAGRGGGGAGAGDLTADYLASLPPRAAYWTVLQYDTPAAYRVFLRVYPNHRLSASVRAILSERREAEAWRRAVVTGTPEAYQQYLQQFPYSPRRYEAEQRIVTLGSGMPAQRPLAPGYRVAPPPPLPQGGFPPGDPGFEQSELAPPE